MNLVKYKLNTNILKRILLVFIGTILLTISAKIKIEEIIKIIKNENVDILDISTDDGDLEDVFIELTKN